MMHDVIKPCGAPRPWPKGVRVEAFGENPSSAKLRFTAKTPRKNIQPDHPTRHRQIGQSSRILTVDTP
jgi:hypothetical protein